MADQAGDGARVHDSARVTISDQLAAPPAGERKVTAAKTIFMRLDNSAEMTAAAERRYQIAAQCKDEGFIDRDEIETIKDRLAPLPEPKYLLEDERSNGDFVLVHAGEDITLRELARFGLTEREIATSESVK